MVLDTVVNHGKSADNPSGTQNPSRDEYIHVAVGRAGCPLWFNHQEGEDLRYRYSVRMPYTGSTGGLQCFVYEC